MLINIIQISLTSLLIILIVSFFVASVLHRKKLLNFSEKFFCELERKIDKEGISIKHKIEILEAHLKDMSFDIKDLNIRTNVVETRLEERNSALLLSSSAKLSLPPPPKRGRPRKIPQQ